MNHVHAVLDFVSGSKIDTLKAIIGLEAILTFAFVICSFVVAGTANAGFNCVLTAFLNIAFIGGSYHVIKNSKAPIAVSICNLMHFDFVVSLFFKTKACLRFQQVGFVIGSGAMMASLNFMTAVYWGQLSKCTSLGVSLGGYSCTNTAAYGAVCAFAVMLFLCQLGFTTAVVLWRSELISEVGLYDDISTSGHDVEGGVAYTSKYDGVSAAVGARAATSADL
jgi:hypothetical protein